MSSTRLGRERGAIGVLFAVLIVAMFTMVAIVVDLGAARLQVRDNQSIADFAALAGGAQLPHAPVIACNDAWGYIKANARDLPVGATMPCVTFPISCSVSTAPKDYVSVGSGGYAVTFRYPIPDSELQPSRVMDGITGIVNQNQCERMKVTVERQRPSFFQGVVGGGFTRLSSSAVVRSVLGSTNPAIVALLILDPHGCNSLTTSGQGKIQVFESGDTPPRPGKIGIDSDGTLTSTQNHLGPPERRCDSSNTYVIDAYGTNASNSQIKAWQTPDGVEPGVIAMYAFARGQTTCNTSTSDPPNMVACEQADVDATRVDPLPQRVSQRATREQIDNVYNCLDPHPRPKFPTATPPYIELNGCPDAGTRDPYIAHLVGEVGSTSPCPNGLPCPPNGTATAFCSLQSPGAGCPTISNYPSGMPCSLNSSDPSAVVPEGNWYIDCSTFRVKTTVAFLGGNVVSKGTISVESASGFLELNATNSQPALPSSCLTAIRGCAGTSSATHAYLFMRSGSLTNGAGGSMKLNRVAVYLDKADDKGKLDFTAQGTLTWHSPIEGPLKNLLLWSESAAQHNLGGQSTLNTTGVFFMPYANPMNYAGGSCIGALSSQFVVFRMQNTGQGCLNMRPTYDQVAPIKFVGSNLIR